MTSRIVLIHAVKMAIDPITASFQSHWPEAELVNLLDDSLSKDRAASKQLNKNMIDRFSCLGKYAVSIKADGILFTCSAFGPAIEAVAQEHTIPILKPNEAMFAMASKIGGKIGMLVTFKNSIQSMTQEFEHMVDNNEAKVVLRTQLVEDAMELLNQGNIESHNELLVKHAKTMDDCNAIMLAQFSMAIAYDAINKQINVPILTAPDAAVKLLKKLVLK